MAPLPYVIMFDDDIVGQILGYPLAISANYMNIPIATMELYITLRFFGVRNIKSFWWMWSLIHQDRLPRILITDLIDALPMMKQLGIPMYQHWEGDGLTPLHHSHPSRDYHNHYYQSSLPSSHMNG